MGVDVVVARNAAVGLVLLLPFSLIYAAVLNHLAARRGAAFFFPGFLVGVSGLLAWSLALEYSRSGSAAVGQGGIAQTLTWTLAPAVVGAWFACRSVRGRIRRGSAASLLRPAGGFLGGVGLAAMIQLVAQMRPWLSP
jgi:mannose/fructose/N-acetylgalactosamine-specific phosphotransferase system component IIC